MENTFLIKLRHLGKENMEKYSTPYLARGFLLC
jgi:hypothetical protein